MGSRSRNWTRGSISTRIPKSTSSSWSPSSEDKMTIDLEALQRAMRSQFPAPELAPEASDWMREIVVAVGSNPFLQRERDVLKFLEGPLNRLKNETPEVRLAFVFEALNEIGKSSSFHLKLKLKIVA